jgi:bifunctional DNase/RNase
VIEVRVGAVERHPVTAVPLVALEPRDPAIRTRLVLPLSPAVACSLSHELDGHTTLRSTAYTLLMQLAGALGGEVSAVEIVPAADGMAAGRLCIAGPVGGSRLPVEIALGIGLAVVLGLPLRVSEELVRDAPPLERSASTTDVPEAFRRAFPG